MNGHFSAFKNREKNNEINKFSRRDKLVKRKSSLIEYGSFGNDDNKNLPSLTEEELSKIKKSIQLKERKNNIKLGVSFFSIIVILIYLSIKYNVI